MKNDYAHRLAENLKDQMPKNKKSQADICRDLGFDKSMVSTWVRGIHVPRMDKLDALCSYFGCSRNDLLGWTDYKYDVHITGSEYELLRIYRTLDEPYRERLAEIIRFYVQEQKKDGENE